MEILNGDSMDFSKWMEVTDAKQKVKPAKAWINELIDRLYSPIKIRQSYLPWPKTKNLIQFRPGEVTIWGGANGSGKSLVTGMVGMSFCTQEDKVCIASFEMKPMKTLERMVRQFSHEDPRDPMYASSPEAISELSAIYSEFRDWTEGKMWLYDQQGTVTPEKLYGVIRYFARELKGTQFFIDSLMKCIHGEDDLNGQKQFIDTLCSIARDEDIHIHLIHHIRKPPNEDHRPNKYDYKGSGSITDQVDNVISVWRDKSKEKKSKETNGRNDKSVSNNDPDVLLICDKQRNGEWEGSIGLWFDKKSQQYLANFGDAPMRMEHHPLDP